MLRDLGAAACTLGHAALTLAVRAQAVELFEVLTGDVPGFVATAVIVGAAEEVARWLTSAMGCK